MRISRRFVPPLAAAIAWSCAELAYAAPPRSPSVRQAPARTACEGAGSLAVTVVETAGTRAYLRPGASAGVRPSSRVTIRGREYTVVVSSDSYAVVEVGEQRLREQESGCATLAAEEAQKAVELPKPRPTGTWKNAWSAEAPPAAAQQPRYLPLGGEERSRRFDVQFSVTAAGLIPLGGQVGDAIAMGELDTRLHAEPFAAPVTLDMNASLQGWGAPDLASRVGGSTRSLLLVRELLAGYSLGSFYAGVGRMRYAASTLGALDGIRVQKGLGDGFSMGAFGGLLPNPLSGSPSLDAQRFGVEARYSRPDFGLRPEAALVANGSTFDGALDERRVSGAFSLYPGSSRFGGYFEVSNFDANNPWKASTVELTAAGVDESVRFGSFELSGHFDVRKPERSLWLASYLPASWFCTTIPAPASNPTAGEPCNGGVDTRAYGEIDGGVELDHLSLVVGGLTVNDLTQSNEPETVGGFVTARVLRIAQSFRIEASGNYSRSTYIDMSGGTAGPGITLFGDALDLSAYYRLTVLQYRSDGASLLHNGIGGMVEVFPNADVLFTLQAEGTTGDDANALTIFGTATWRPRLQ